MRRVLAVVGMVAGLVLAPVARAETLADALIAAYRTSNLLDQNQAVLRAADEDAAVAVARLRPVVEYTVNAGWRRSESTVVGPGPTFARSTPYSDSLSGSVTLSASMSILDFGRGKAGTEIARESVLATRQALISVEQEVLLEAVEAYVDVRLQNEIVALRNSNLRLITQELRAARDRFEVGEITRTDVALAEARLASSRAGLAAAEGSLAVARERYKAAVGAYPGNLAGLPRSPAIPRSLDEARSLALNSHPAIRQSQHQVKIADLRIELAKAQMRPSLRGQASITENFDGLDNQSIGLTFGQTIYAGGELSALYRRALAGKEAERAGLHQTGVVIGQSVGNAWASLQVAAVSIEAGDRQVRAAQTAFDGVREEATLGARTTLDVLDAEQDLLDARNARLEAEANRYVGVYRLLATMGLLTVDHLKLGIPTYDPEAYYNAVRTAPATSAQGKKLDRILEKIGN